MGKFKKITHVVLSDKEKFLMHLSHQIRTPLFSISGLTEILQSSKLDKQQHEYVAHINSSIDTISDLVNYLLEFIQLENNTKVLKEDIFSLEDVINKIMHLHRPTIVEKGLQLKYFIDREIPTSLRGDRSIIQLLVNNIVSNAVKYTYSGSVEIRLNLLEERAHATIIEIKVQDTGIGIPASMIEKIFESERAPSVDYSEQMAGPPLGLMISRQFAELMHGSISVQSTEGRGSTFTIRLQINKDLGKAKVKPVKTEEIYFNELHVLLVEDNPINQIVTQKILQLNGINVELADNGKIAVEMLNQHPYDIILMDLQMPVMDGYATAKFIRTEMSGQLNKIPIIAYTAHAFQGEAAKCFEAGMNDYITKPFSTEELIQKIARLVPEKSNVYSKSSAAQKVKEYKNDTIDLSYLHELSGGNRQFVKEVIEVFLKEIPKEMLLAQTEVEAKNLDELYKIIHKMKPSFALVGMHQASEAILEMLLQCKTTRDSDKINIAFRKIHAILSKAIPILEMQLVN